MEPVDHPEGTHASGNDARLEREITRIMNAARDGVRASNGSQPESAVGAELLPLVYQQLRALAQRQLANERRSHTLQATALVHEAYLRIAPGPDVPWNDRAHFFRAAAQAMRRILVDHARARMANKRGGQGPHRISLDLADAVSAANSENPADAIALDDAIQRLRGEDPRAAEVVHLRFYAGLSVDETAAVLGVSPRTVDLDWKLARAFLYKQLSADARQPGG